MILIGMLHHRKYPLKVKKAYAYAAVCMAEGAKLLFFSPKTVDFKLNVIHGYMYKKGKWEKVDSRFPDVIYNSGSPYKLKKSKEIIDKLKSKIPFTTYAIGNKLKVFNRLMEDGEFNAYLIPSIRIDSLKTFKTFIKQYPKVVIKPVGGHKGEGIFYIEKDKSSYHVYQNETAKTVSFLELQEFILTKIKQEDYLIQPYIKSITKNNLAYDFRLHTQKNGDGNWVITAIYPRIGKKGSIVTNINQGGYTNYADPFLKQEFGVDYKEIKTNLEDFCLRLAQKMDEIQEKKFHETLDELGIDIGLDENKKIWLYEINWRPGCPPAFYLELDVVRNLIRYAIYLAKKNQ